MGVRLTSSRSAELASSSIKFLTPNPARNISCNEQLHEITGLAYCSFSSRTMMSGRKTLEVNPNHPVIVDLLAKVKANKEDASALDTAQVLFQTALIQSGYDIADPSALVNRVYRLMSKELGVDPDAPLKEIEVPEEEEEAEEDDKEDGDESDEKDEEAESKEDL